MEPESRPPRRFLDLPGLEERNQSARRPIDRIQILPEEPGRRGHLGMLSGPWRVQCQPIADRASFGASPPERYSQLAVRAPQFSEQQPSGTHAVGDRVYSGAWILPLPAD